MMLTQTDIKNLLKYFLENYIIVQFENGYSCFTELRLKSDVYSDSYIQNPCPVGDKTGINKEV